MSGLGALGTWAAGGEKTGDHHAAESKALDLGIHRDGVLWLLRKRLELCCGTQQSMMEARLKREMEKNRSVLANASAPLPGYTPVPDVATRGSGTWEKSTGVSGLAPDEHGSYAPDTGLTEEQVQMFEKGNQDMMTHYQMTLDKVRYRHELEPSHRSQPRPDQTVQNRRKITSRNRGATDNSRQQSNSSGLPHRPARRGLGERSA